MSNVPKAWNMSNAMLIAASDTEWESLWNEHLIAFKKLKNGGPAIEYQLLHAKLDRIRLERMLQALRYKMMKSDSN